MNMNMEAIINQNNGAFASLRGNDYPSAITASTSALIHQQQLEGTSSEDDISSVSDCPLDICMSQSQNATDEHNSNDANCMYIYKHSILLPAHMTDPTIITPILIFNSALAHQLVAPIHDNATYIRCLEKAKRLYELAYNSQDWTQNVLFQFAVINNIAVIDRQLGNVESSQLYFQHLMSTFLLFVYQGNGGRLRCASPSPALAA